ncbi:hypothetical protein BDW59DRAFT_140138 [Aspergillus cavernicola]|uniref:Fungal-specific transcription factor domain-containing protein n=1 Tax=Aspergillus cavernicola TaxID=176166 RepID=A0ABR4IUF1_9EURO
MKLHQREIHGRRELSDLASFARPVKLQTFFRGTKLRYFEVTPLSESDSTIDYDDAEEEEDSSVDVDTAIPLPLPNLDLETLTYFHHFTTATSLTLPVAGDEQSATQNWQTDVVLHALQRQWLMCGLLAISACHLAVLVEDASIRQAHRERSAQFFSAFSAEWEAMKVSKGMSEDKDAMRAGAQIACILRCVHWTPGSTVDPAAVSQLQLFMATIRSFDPDAVSFQSNIHHHVQTVPKNVVEAFNRLHTLPALMAETFSRPDNVQDVLATLTAIAMLIECCDMSFSSSGMGAAWHSMTMWLVRVPEHFNELTRRNSPSALVVIGYWEAILVKRAEDCGCWFLKGLQMAEQVKLELKLGLELGCQALGVPEVVASLLP